MERLTALMKECQIYRKKEKKDKGTQLKHGNAMAGQHMLRQAPALLQSISLVHTSDEKVETEYKCDDYKDAQHAMISSVSSAPLHYSAEMEKKQIQGQMNAPRQANAYQERISEYR